MFNVVKTFCLALLLFTTANAAAVLPPKYLSIKDFKKCMATRTMGSWTAWCVPSNKPTNCPADSWKQLANLQDREKVPNCIETSGS